MHLEGANIPHAWGDEFDGGLQHNHLTKGCCDTMLLKRANIAGHEAEF